MVQIILPSCYHIRDSLLLQALFQQAGLVIGAVEDGDIGKASGSIQQAGGLAVGIQHVDSAHHAVDFFGNEDGLRQAGLCCHQTHRTAVGTGG